MDERKMCGFSFVRVKDTNSWRVLACQQAFLNALFALREENVFGVFRLEVDTVIEEFESVTKTLREEAFKRYIPCMLLPP